VVYVILLVIGTISELSDLLYHLVVNIDWVTVITNSKLSSAPQLSELNNVKQRLSIVCKIISPIIVAGLYYGSVITCLVTLIVWMIISCVSELLILRSLYYSFPDLLSGKAHPLGPSGERIEENQPFFITEPIKIFYSQTSFSASLSFIMIQFSALCPGAILINYMVYTNASTIEVAFLQSIGSGIGIISMFGTPKIIEKIGLSLCGLISIWVYFLLLLIGFLKVVIMGSSIWLLIIPIMLSRIFVWSYEITEIQIIKESVDDSIISKVNSIEYQLSHIMTLLSYSVAIMSISPKNFIYQAGASLATVFIGGLFFTIWYRNYGKVHELTHHIPEILD